MQAAPLSVKVSLTKERIRQWVKHYGEDGVYVSFSGGKDSTVLLNIVREMYPNIPAAFCDTGLEYPEVRNFVKTWENVEWLKPRLTFKQVIEKYGYPFISKEVSRAVYQSRRRLIKGLPLDTVKAKQLLGVATEKNGKLSMFNIPKYKFMLYAPFNVSDNCCYVMKKSILHDYNIRTNRTPITGQMAQESRQRTAKWKRYGCNAFEAKNPISNPMSFWYEQDVLRYIKVKNIPIASVYGEIVEDDELPGQMTWDEYAGFDTGAKNYTTTGCKRTGCMFCGYGCHLEKPGEGRFERMKKTHPKQYEYIMKPWEEGGLGYKEVIDWLNENGNLHIGY